jgi:hypothetical protein
MRTLLALVTLALPVRDAVACKCYPVELADAVDGAPVVFVGRLVHETKTPLDPEACKRKPADCSYSYSYTVAVEGVWKGKVAATVEIPTGTAGGDCTMGELRGERWLFVADDKLEVRMCNGTQPATPAVVDKVQKVLGPPRRPKA